MPSVEDIYSRTSDCVSRTIADETVVVPVRGRVADLESIFTFNEVGTAIWGRLDGRTPIRSVIEWVCEEFDVPRETAEQDTAAFVAELESFRLIEAVTPAEER